MKKAIVVLVALIGGLFAVVAPSSPASAAVPTRIDIGAAVKQGGYAKASGSYSNGSGEIQKVCVYMSWERTDPKGWKTYGGWGLSCRYPYAGQQESFSATDTYCGYPSDYLIFWGVVRAYRADGSLFDEKMSNVVQC